MLTLMKGDEGINLIQGPANKLLLFLFWQRQFKRKHIRIAYILLCRPSSCCFHCN